VEAGFAREDDSPSPALFCLLEAGADLPSAKTVADGR
jgi:hypothetical protein